MSRQGSKGLGVRYTITDCPLGRLLVAATPKGICTIKLGDDDVALEAALLKAYPAAEMNPNDAKLKPWVEALLRYMRGEQPSLDLPLDVQATAFQQRVWKLLQTIPYGSTRSYGQIARALQRPHAARAVARACAANPVALIVPCHRVVRNDGRLGGYQWGTHRKQALLEQEQKGLEGKIR